MEWLIKKENDIFEILNKFVDSKLEFILVGGYAVSAFKHRFSVDADIVVKSENLPDFENILKKSGFKKTIGKELKDAYSSKFVRYEKEQASVDILIGALASRTTNASFSYDLILSNSIKEMIIGMKIHSGRLTDFRDIAALAKDTNLDLIRKYLFIGDLKELNKNLSNLHNAVNDKKFIDSFKGVFIEKKFDIDLEQIRKISDLRK